MKTEEATLGHLREERMRLCNLFNQAIRIVGEIIDSDYWALTREHPQGRLDIAKDTLEGVSKTLEKAEYENR